MESLPDFLKKFQIRAAAQDIVTDSARH